MNNQNPNRWGPGVWQILHDDSVFFDNSKEDQLLYCRLIRDRFSKLRCDDCRKDIMKYLEIDPPENYVGLKNGLLIWSVKCHNYVNKKLGKPIIPEEEAKALYLNPQICYKDCSTDNNSQPLVSVAPESSPIVVSVKPYQKKNK